MRGQIYIGVLIALAILVILGTALFSLVVASFDLITFSRARVSARHLAEEKMELIKNLPYEDIGTLGGIPPGNLPQTESDIVNGLSYTTTTYIQYVDNDFDGLAPTDTDPNDYKKITLDVTWEGLSASKSPITLTTDISPKAEEGATGGVLIVQVFDSTGTPVDQADVTIIADSTIPPVNTVQKTDSDGLINLPGSPSCVSCYQISATKTGMSTDRTYSEDEVTNPIKPYQSVFEGQTTYTSFVIDTLSSINISSYGSRASGFPALGDLAFNLHGSKSIGTDAFGQNVYKYDKALSTDSGGGLVLNDMEWGAYTLYMPTGSARDISGTNPVLPFAVAPGGTADVSFSTEDQSDYNVLTIFTDPGSQILENVSVNLSGNGSYDETLTSGSIGDPDYGQAFFSGLSEASYTLSATLPGFNNFTEPLDVFGPSIEKIILAPQ